MAGLAEFRAHIHQAGAEHGALGGDDVGALGLDEARCDLGDQTVAEQNVGGLVEAAGRVDDPGAGDECVPQLHRGHGVHRRTICSGRARRSSTAMRMATPISTCSRMTLWTGSSATALSISTPRFIGPGCITSALGLA
jgi:hypothetical protein